MTDFDIHAAIGALRETMPQFPQPLIDLTKETVTAVLLRFK